MKYLSKEYKFVTNKNFKLKLGTIDKTRPTTFYIQMSTWLGSNFDEDVFDIFSQNFNTLKHNFLKFISKFKLSTKHIIDYSLSTDFNKGNRQSLLTIDLMLKQKDEILAIKEIKEKTEEDLIFIFNHFLLDLENNGFSYSLKKGMSV